MDARIVIGTSIAPFDVEKQRECISSWIRSGFKVYSYNCKAEIKQLKPLFLDMDVTFMEIERSAVEYCGKELPFIQDILNGISGQAESVCGYFNSDIYFEHITESLYQYIFSQAKDSLVVVHRNEIDSLDDIERLNWSINLDGIDGFFIDKNKAKCLYEDWAYVQTIWDTFLLIMCKRKEIPVKTLFNPIAFHKRHKVRWNYGRTQKTYDAVIQKYYGSNEDGRREIFYDKYNNLYEYSKGIAYCERTDYKTLFCVEGIDENLEESIRKQGLENYEITDSKVEKGQNYDFVFHVKKGTVLDPAFCRFAFYLFECYRIKEVDIGRFFISEIGHRMIFNQLNKNIPQLLKINRECELFIHVNSKKATGTCAPQVLYPVCYERIDIFDKGIIDRVMLEGPTYIMPAGYRSGEWYGVNRSYLGAIEMKGCLDNDLSKVGDRLLGQTIYPATDVLGKSGQYNLILCTKYYQEEIRKQIAPNSAVNMVDADSVLWVGEAGELYVFCMEKFKKRKII